MGTGRIFTCIKPVLLVIGDFKDEGEVHPRTGHEGQEGD
jgi:hypothetical protein